ncbi:MAG: hypothetical protein IJJ26_08325 [Victivallales bacterium]|nr:hypothetical protein [Victivallales bacterium]
MKKTTIWTICSKRYKVTLESTGSLTLVDTASRTTWRSESPFQMRYGNYYDYDLVEHCRMQVKATSNSLIVRFDQFDWFGRCRENPYRKPDPGPALKFQFGIQLDEEKAVFSTEPPQGMEDEDLKVTFPARLIEWKTTAQADVILPNGYGTLFQFPRKDAFQHDFLYFWDYTAMPFYGVLRKKAGGLAILLRQPCDSSMRFDVSTTQRECSFLQPASVFTPLAMYRREVWLVGMAPGATWVELAKWYRSLLQREHRFVTLKEKMAASPEVEKLVGTVVWKHNVYATKTLPKGVHHSYSLYCPSPAVGKVEGTPNDWTAREVFTAAHQAGFDRLAIFNCGWNRGGYDSQYPVRLPPNPVRGTPRDFQDSAAFGRSLSPDYIFSFHDNYRDTYRNAPDKNYRKDLMRDRSGTILQGGIWRGGRAELLCAKCALKYAKRDIPKMVKLSGRGSIYVDVLGCTKAQECYAPHHLQSQRDDIECRRTLLSYVKSQFGSIVTEGNPADVFADIVDLGAFAAFHYRIPSASVAPSLPIPFWQLVYHDSVLSYTCEGAYGVSGNDYLALQALYNLLPTALDPVSLRLSRELRECYTSEMLSHRFLAKPKGPLAFVAETRFSCGITILANTTDAPFRKGKLTIPPHDFLVLTNVN